MSSEERKHLREIVEHFDTAMLITRDEKDQPVGRPMSVAEHDKEKDILWFATSVQTDKADEISQRPDTALVFQGSNRYASLTGRASMENDRERIKTLFNKGWELWFPEGPEQDDIRLIRFEPHKGEYWDMSGTRKAGFIWQAAKALAGNESMQEQSNATDTRQHGETTL